MSRTSRPPILWLQLLLIGGLACVVIILAQTFRAMRSSRAVAEHALRDYASFAAWSYRQNLVTSLRGAVDELLGPVNHGDGLHTSPRIPNAHDLGHFIYVDQRCNCHVPQRGPLPEHFLGFTLGSDTLAVGNNLAPKGMHGWLVDPPDGKAIPIRVISYAADDRQWINNLLTTVARRPRSDWGYDVMVVRRDSATRFLASRSMPTYRGDTIVYAVEYRSDAIDTLLSTVIGSSDLLPPSLVAGRRNKDILDLEVSDAQGTPLFSTRPARWELDASARLPDSYGGLNVRAQLRPDMAEAMLIGGTPDSRVPLLLVILVIALGLTVLAAVQLRREVRFAGERATFVANVSHELRTPLAQVRLVLDTLRLGRDSDAQMRGHALGVADREVLRLQHLVEGVLRFTRGARRDDAARVRSDLAREARTIAQEFGPLAAPTGVRIDVTGDAAVEATLQNGAFRQVLLNLLDNALKYGKENSTVTVDVRRRTNGGVTLTVTDAGPGVPPTEREAIWRPFQRGGLAKQRAVGGSGIGLTIVREIAQEHAGSARVEDAPGGDGGARFVVELSETAA